MQEKELAMAEYIVDEIMSVRSNKISDYSVIYHPTAKAIAVRMIELIQRTEGISPEVHRLYDAVKQEIENL